MPPLMARYRVDEMPAKVEKIVADAGSSDERISVGTAPGDWRKLRGIPALGPHVPGAMMNTRPDREAIRRLSA